MVTPKLELKAYETTVILFGHLLHATCAFDSLTFPLIFYVALLKQSQSPTRVAIKMLPGDTSDLQGGGGV